MSICHCLSVKKRVSVKNVKILEMSDFGNTDECASEGSQEFDLWGWGVVFVD